MKSKIKYIWKLLIIAVFIIYSINDNKAQVNNLDSWRVLEEDANAFKTIPQQYDQYLQPLYPDFVRDGIPIEVKNYHRFYSRWNDRLSVDENGDLSFETYLKAAIDYRDNFECNASDPANWIQLGPVQYTQQYMGLVNRLSCKPGNPDDILISSNHGGIWKRRSTGNTWENVNDDDVNLINISATEFIRDPYDPNHIYASTGDGLQGVKYGIGVIESFDNGENWVETNFDNDTYPYVVKIVIDYDNSTQGSLTLYALTKKEIFKSTDSGNTWTTVVNTFDLPTGIEYYDIQVKNETLFIGTKSLWGNYGSILYTFRNGIWENTTSSLGLPDAKRIRISKTKAGKTFLLIDAYGIGRLIYKSTDLGMTWTFLVNLVDNNIHVFSPKCNIYYSEESNMIYSGSLRLWYFNINTPNQFHHYYPDHVDIRDIESLGVNSNNEEELLVATDGSIAKYVVDLDNLSSISETNLNGNYLPIGNYFGLGVNNRYGDFVVAGATHINNFQYLNDEWTKFGGGDGADCSVNPITPFGLHYYQNQFQMYRRIIEFDEDGNPTASSKSLHPHSASFIGSRFYINPLNPFEILMGSVNELAISDESDPDNVNVVVKSTPTELEKVRAIAINNQNTIFISNYGATSGSTINQFVKSTNNGDTWDDMGNKLVYNADGSTYGDISNITNLLYYKSLNDIICDLDNSNNMWIGLGGIMRQPWPNQALPLNEKFRVLRSTDGGETWYDYSEGLPALPVKKMIRITLDTDYLFIGTDVGVFYRTADMNEWQCFQNGLPIAVVTDLEYDYCTNRLYISTDGRGNYYSGLPEPIQDI